MEAEFDRFGRGASYRHANDTRPEVRARELRAMVHALALRGGEAVLELGPGSGTLTAALMQAVGDAGSVVAIDDSAFVRTLLRTRMPGLDVRALAGDTLPFEKERFDVVASLANFHHMPDKKRMLGELARVLRPGGRIVIGDVAHGTDVQAYFDEVVHEIASTGHLHTFLRRRQTRAWAEDVGLTLDWWMVRDVSWTFTLEPDDPHADVEALAGWYLRTIHDARISAEECFALAQRYLDFWRLDDRHAELHWQLAYLRLSKP